MRRTILACLILVMLIFSSATIFAGSDSAVTIVSPSQSVTGSSLLISVKLTAPKNIKVYAYEEKEKVNDILVSVNPSKLSAENLSSKSLYSVSIMTPETYESTGTLQFYNKQIDDVTPGLYRVRVEVLDKSNTVTASSVLRVLVMPKDSEEITGSEIFQSQQTGALQWVQNLLKNIFKN